MDYQQEQKVSMTQMYFGVGQKWFYGIPLFLRLYILWGNENALHTRNKHTNLISVQSLKQKLMANDEISMKLTSRL